VPRPPEVLKASYSVPSRLKCSRPFERQGRDELAAVDGLAGVAVLVDQAVHRPGQVVLELVRREGGQRADAHLHVAHLVELLGQVVGDDADEARRQPALRHEGGLGTLAISMMALVAATSSVRSK
jgi:hypothetical protein